ncbi:MAG: hypothetical protein M1814_005067 [Vezdaea aestivalis]|nr:MAG: hypothetical protein M1814_005067 [Vezdaea aestivalis]
MPNIVTSFDHLANLEKYSHEKPYLALLPPADDFDPRKDRRDNLEFKTHTGIVVHDIRHSITSYRVEDCGFEVFHHQTNFPILEDELALKHYQDETAGFLENFFNAVHVTCYDIRLRRNVSMPRETFDFNDKMLLEGPARGAHIDVTMNSGPEIIDRYLSPIEKDLYLRPGYRIQIFK